MDNEEDGYSSQDEDEQFRQAEGRKEYWHFLRDIFQANKDEDSDSSDGLKEYVPPPKIARKKRKVWEAIQCEMRALLSANKHSKREELLDLKKEQLLVKFLGDVSDFVDNPGESFEDREKQVIKLLQKCVERWFPCAGENKNEEILAQEDVEWLVDNDEMVYRIVHRLNDSRFDTKSNQFDFVPFKQVEVNAIIRIRMERLREQFGQRLKVNLNEVAVTAKDERRGQELSRLLREIALADEQFCDDAQESGEAITDIFGPNGISAGVLAVSERIINPPEATPEVVADDLVQNEVELDEEHMESLRESRYSEIEEEIGGLNIVKNLVADGRRVVVGEVDLNKYVEDEQSRELQSVMRVMVLSVPEKTSAKSCLKKKKGNHFSDVYLHNMKIEERRAWCNHYKALPKKKVNFADLDMIQVQLVYNDFLRDFANEHWDRRPQEDEENFDEEMHYPPNHEIGWLPAETTMTVGVESNYAEYRENFTATKRASVCIVPDPSEYKHKINSGQIVEYESFLKEAVAEGPVKETDDDTLVLPAHQERRLTGRAGRDYCVLDLAAYKLHDDLRRLIRYGEFWQPKKKINEHNREMSYHHCYGPMIISDGMLEDAEPKALKNTGLFVFQRPLTIEDLLVLVDQITVREFGVRDVIITWGFDLITKNGAEEAAAELMRAYIQVKAIFDRKREEFMAAGFDRLVEPKYHLLTIPESPDIDRLIDYNNIVRRLAKWRNISLIDWAEQCRPVLPEITEHTANVQLRVLYALLHEQAGVIPHRTLDQRILQFQNGKMFENGHDWIVFLNKKIADRHKRAEEAKRRSDLSSSLSPEKAEGKPTTEPEEERLNFA